MKFTEYLRLNESETKVQPKNKDELKKIIEDTIKEQGNKCDLNFIDTSLIKDMGRLFSGSKFNGDISKWNVSNVINMCFMFKGSKFNGVISKWDVSKVENMSDMFAESPLEDNEPDWYLCR